MRWEHRLQTQNVMHKHCTTHWIIMKYPQKIRTKWIRDFPEYLFFFFFVEINIRKVLAKDGSIDIEISSRNGNFYLLYINIQAKGDPATEKSISLCANCQCQCNCSALRENSTTSNRQRWLKSETYDRRGSCILKFKNDKTMRFGKQCK